MKLFFREIGSGDPVVILHGLFGMSDNWMTIARKIGLHHRVLIPDMRNHGRSPWAEAFNYKVLAEDVLELITDQGLEKVRLIGHSMGGKTAIGFSMQYPEKVRQLVVVDIVPKTYKHVRFKQFMKQLIRIDLQGLQSRQEADRRLAESIFSLPIRQFLLKNLYRDENMNFKWRINLNSLLQNIGNILDRPQVLTISELPTLFLRGGKSDYISDEDIPRIKAMFPQAKVVTIPQATHWLHADAPDALCGELSRFFDER